MTILSAAITLILVMDPVGNIPIFIAILSHVDPKRRKKIIVRESLIAFVILLLFLFFGRAILHVLHVSEPALGIAGGIILFLIAIKMIFPPEKSSTEPSGEPFIVPLAIPLVAGPSALAMVLLFASQQRPGHLISLALAIFIASFVCTVILLLSGPLRKILGKKGLIALERLMGMILTTIAVQMFLTGLTTYLTKNY
ncbi:MAG: NAAT family transporter [Gammaproteobacteria bacterium]|nr:NAAT family transporter [Gammaproteobacteria bacterium]